MHTNNWRPLNARDAESYEKKKKILYIYFLLRPAALQSFLLAKANVPGPRGLISTKTRRPQVLPLPPPPPLLDALSDCLIHRRCAGIHVLSAGRAGQNYANMT
jgi:hypothetical protein